MRETTERADETERSRPVASRRRRRRNPKIWIALAGVAVVVFAVWRILSAFAGDSSSPRYTTSAAEKSTLAVTVDGSGYVYAGTSASLSPKVSGTVRGLHAAVGQVVRRGDELFTIHNDDLDAAVTRASSSYHQSRQSVHQAELQLLEARQQLDKLENPQPGPNGKTSTPSESDLEIARERVYGAEQGLSAAKDSRNANYAAYEKAIEDRDESSVTSPIDGVVTEVNVANGDSVSSASYSSAASSSGSGQSSGSGASSSGGSSSSGSASGSSSAGSGSSGGTVVVTSMRSLYAKIPINEVDVSKVRRGQKVTATFDALPNLTITGKVTRISPSGTNSSGVVTFDVNVSFDVQTARVKPGMSTQVSIVTALARDAIVVPNSAVQTANGESYVQLLANASGTGTPQDVSVTTGMSNDTMTQIKSGLKAGQHVVTGQRVTSSSGSSGGGFRFPGMGGGVQRSTGSGGSGGSSGKSSGSGTPTQGSGSSGGHLEVAPPPGP